MSVKEQIISKLDTLPEYTLIYILGIINGSLIAPDIPNAETVAAIEALERGEGETFEGSTEDFIKMMLED